MTIQSVIDIIEEFAPLKYAEDFDNVGLLVGDPSMKVSNALITLDTLEATVDEAIEKECNLIISFHPIIFSGLKKLTGKNYVERVVMKAIKHDIAIYAIHTALDNHIKGVSDMMAEKLGLINRKILVPKAKTIRKILVHVPMNTAEVVRQAMFNAGAGHIGNYSDCSFNVEGEGSFKPNDDANPTIGEKGAVHFEKEVQIGMIYPIHLEYNILSAMKKAHPYEEVAYEIISIENQNQEIGIGMVGELEKAEAEADFLQKVKETFNCGCVRHSRFTGKPVQKVAVLGGSGAFAISNARQAGADIYITADLKYHDFFQAEEKLILADIGHYESEQFTKNLLYSFLSKKISNFALILAETNTNPINYI